LGRGRSLQGAEKAGKSPAFRCYAKDLLVDTDHLSDEEFGAYWRLCCRAWVGIEGCPQGYLPADPEKLRRVARATPARWKRLSAVVLAFFERDEVTGRPYSKRLLEELAKQQERSGTARQSAELSWKVRRGDTDAIALHSHSRRNAARSDEQANADESASASGEVGEHEGEESAAAALAVEPYVRAIEGLYPRARVPLRGDGKGYGAWLVELRGAVLEALADLPEVEEFAGRLVVWTWSDDWHEGAYPGQFVPPAERFVRKGWWRQEPRKPRPLTSPGYAEELAKLVRELGLEEAAA
jgi:uncharacterized protein YdaU (DUF1376 family)